MSYQLKKISDHLLEIRVTYDKDLDQSFLLSADWHIDNNYCDQDLLFSHLQEAKEKSAGVFCFGDLYCLMQGKKDRRSSKSALRDEDKHSSYLDTTEDNTCEKLKPYKDTFCLFSEGNHETAIANHLETHPLKRLVDKLNYKYGSPVKFGNYQGWVRFRFQRKDGGNIQTFYMAYHHGAFGGIITKGTLSVSRYASIFPRADIIASGHTHDKWLVRHGQTDIKENGEQYIRQQVHVKCGTYKKEFAKGSGWAVEKIVAPKSYGGYWLQFYYKNQKVRFRLIEAD